MVASFHAQGRVTERIGMMDADVMLSWMWKVGRAAVPQDFVRFRTTQVDGYEYRVAVTRGQVWLIVRGVVVKQFVTVMKRRK